MDMLSKELYIMDRNTERLMVEELNEQVIFLLNQNASLLTEQASLLTEQASLYEKRIALCKTIWKKDDQIAKLQGEQN